MSLVAPSTVSNPALCGAFRLRFFSRLCVYEGRHSLLSVNVAQADDKAVR